MRVKKGVILAIGLVCLLALAIFLALKPQYDLDRYFKQGKYEEFMALVAEVDPRRQDQSNNERRIFAINQVRLNKCKAESGALLLKLESLEREDKYEEIEKAGQKCAGTNPKVDQLLRDAKNPQEAKFAKAPVELHVETLNQILTNAENTSSGKFSSTEYVSMGEVDKLVDAVRHKGHSSLPLLEKRVAELKAANRVNRERRCASHVNKTFDRLLADIGQPWESRVIREDGDGLILEKVYGECIFTIKRRLIGGMYTYHVVSQIARTDR